MLQTRILIVEDELTLAKLYAKTLEHAQFQVWAANTISEAHQIIERFDPDIYCLDWQLGGDTAAKILDVIAAWPAQRHPQTLIVSGQYEQLKVDHYKHLLYAVMPKPITIHQLINVAREMDKYTPARNVAQFVSVEGLAADAISIYWEGRVTQEALHQAMNDDISETRFLVFDVAAASVTRTDLELLRISHGYLQNLEKVYLICRPDQDIFMKYILGFVPARCEVISDMTREEIDDLFA